MNVENIEIKPREFVITFTEFEAQCLVRDLKFESKQLSKTGRALKTALEHQIGFIIEDHPSI